MKLPRLMGHRGAAAHAPENTLAGLRKARALGLGWVEVDAQLSGDGVPLLMHDDTLHRTTGDRRRIAEVAATEVCALDAGSWFDPVFAEETVPSLEVAAAEFGRLGLMANIEIKPSPGLARETAVETVALLRRVWPSDLGPPLFSSFHQEALEEAQRLWPEAPRGYLMRNLETTWAETARRLACISLHLWHPGIRAEQAAAIKTAGYQLAAYTVNAAPRAAALVEMGVDCLITDDPVTLTGVASGPN